MSDTRHNDKDARDAKGPEAPVTVEPHDSKSTHEAVVANESSDPIEVKPKN